MPQPPRIPSSAPPEVSLWTRARRAALALLFSLILVIPRLRRLRRRVWAWTMVRCLELVAGALLVWRFARDGAGLGSLMLGLVLIALGALVRARPLRKSVDDVTRELDSLVALNGGTFCGQNGTKPVRDVTIFVGSERLLVLTRTQQQLAEIRVGDLRQVQVERVSDKAGGKQGRYDLLIALGKDRSRVLRFCYEGTFAEHLARVAQDTISSVWKRSLPVFPAGSV